MNEVTVSAVPLVVPPIRGGQQRIKGLVPAMRLQQLLWVPTMRSPHATCEYSWIRLWVPKISSTSRDQEIFADRAIGARVSSDAVRLEIDRFG